jgi:hypothetical protein
MEELELLDLMLGTMAAMGLPPKYLTHPDRRPVLEELRRKVGDQTLRAIPE